MSAENPQNHKEIPKTEEEIKKEALENLKKQNKVVLINAEDLAEKEARDMADARMTESMKNKKGIGGYFKKLWTHTLFDEYYRQKELNRVRKEIQDKGNIYAVQEDANLNHKTAMDAVMDRFSSEYEGTLSKDEEKKVLNKEDQETKNVIESIKKLIYEYAEGTLNYDNFISEKNRVLDSLKNDEVLKGANTYTDNLLEIAKNARIAIEHGAKMKELDLDFDIIIGKAKSSIKTEAHLSLVDKAVEKMQKTTVGKFVNPATMSVAVGLAYSVGVNIGGKKILRSKVAHALTLGGSAVLSGALMGMDESERLAKERSQHAREMAKGGAVEAGDKRRELFEKYRHETKNSKDLEKNLNELVFTKYKGKETTKEDLNKMINCMSEIEARIAISDKNKIDLISYSNPGSVEKERTDLIILLARAKVELRKKLEGELSNLLERSETFDSILKNKNQVVEGTLLGGKNSGIESKDKEFRAFKRKEVAKKIIKTTLASVVIGGTIQEIAAFFKDDVQGFFEGMLKNDLKSQVDTPLQHAVNWMTGRDSSIPMGESIDVKIDDHFIKMPEGTNIIKNPDGTFDIMRGDTVIVDNAPLKFGADGLFDQNSTLILGEHGIVVGSDCKVLENVGAEEVSAKDYVHENMDNTQHIKRDLWYDNNTPKPVFDKNELKLWWGGENNSGMDGKGNYVFNIAHMTKGGSFHENFSVDAQEKIKSGGLKMILSLTRDTQNQVFEVPIDTDGNAIIDPNSEIGKLFFSNENGHAVFQGKYAEVAETFGETDGTEHVKILATHVGEGNDCIEIPKDDEVPINYLEIPRDVEPPMFIPPVLSHRPLEPIGKKKFIEFERTGKSREGVGVNFYGYGYGETGEYGLLSREEYKKRFSKKILENPELDISTSDAEVVKEYFEKQDKDYMKDLEYRISIMPKMKKSIEAVITVPAYQEGDNMEKTIRNYAKLKDRNKFQIVIFENHPKGKTRDNTDEVIKRMKKEFPDLNIIHLYKTFENKPPIGEVRKYLVDAVLLNKQKSKIDKSIAIISNDADLEDIDENYVNNIIEAFKKDKKLDAMSGKWDFPKKDFEKMPLLHASQRLWQYFDIIFRYKYMNSPDLIGRNSVFRSGIYAAIGGYNKNAKLAEDLEIGWLTKEARNYDMNRITYTNKASLVSNSRRAVSKLLSGGRLIEQYGDFHENEEVRGKSVDDLLKDKKDFDIEVFKKEAQAIYEYYSRWKKSNNGWIEDKYVDETFARAMRFMGISYEKDGDSIKITDTSKFLSKLNKEEVIKPSPEIVTPEVKIKKPRKEKFSIKKFKELIDKDPALKEQYGSLVENYELFKKFNKLKDDSIEKLQIIELYKEDLANRTDKNYTVEDFVKNIISSIETELKDLGIGS